MADTSNAALGRLALGFFISVIQNQAEKTQHNAITVMVAVIEPVRLNLV